MLRSLVVAAILVFPQTLVVIADDSKAGKCTILNTTGDPIVIGLYRPSDDGICEQLVRVAPKTQVQNIPVQIVGDSQFVVAYEATLNDATISRSKPFAIVGHTLLNFVKKKNSVSELPDVLIQYRGSSAFRRSSHGAFNTALFLPDSEYEAKRVMRDANHSSQRIETPLAKQEYQETAEP